MLTLRSFQFCLNFHLVNVFIPSIYWGDVSVKYCALTPLVQTAFVLEPAPLSAPRCSSHALGLACLVLSKDSCFSSMHLCSFVSLFTSLVICLIPTSHPYLRSFSNANPAEVVCKH